MKVIVGNIWFTSILRIHYGVSIIVAYYIRTTWSKLEDSIKYIKISSRLKVESPISSSISSWSIRLYYYVSPIRSSFRQIVEISMLTILRVRQVRLSNSTIIFIIAYTPVISISLATSTRCLSSSSSRVYRRSICTNWRRWSRRNLVSPTNSRW